MEKTLKIGIAGLGTVGAGALKILTDQAELITVRSGRPIEVVAVSSRDKKKARGVDTAKIKWLDDALAMATDPNIDVVVETIGGSEGVAKQLVEQALANGKSVVTANKALIAQHGVALAELAEKNNAVLAFEAAVAGGIPIIKALRDGLAANQFTRIAGILNGTCNYILTSMWDTKRSFDDVLAEAQAKGYAEADPSFDVDGIDTGHKLSILTSLAFGTAPAMDKVSVEGIRRMTLRDMQFADELGYAVKLLGIAAMSDKGISQRVHPCLVPKDSALASVPSAVNAILIEGDSVGTVFFEGRGAGAGPTGSSVVADIMDIARGTTYKPFTLPVAKLKKLAAADMASLRSSYYLRIGVVDRPGVLAEVTGIFKQEQISVRSFIQHSQQSGQPVQVVITTDETTEAAMQKAIAAISKLEAVKESPYMIRIEHI